MYLLIEVHEEKYCLGAKFPYPTFLQSIHAYSIGFGAYSIGPSLDDSMAKRRWRKAREGQVKCTVLYLPSQLSPVWSSEKPRWHSQTKLPGVFWQMPFAPHKLISVAHSLLSEGNQSLSVTFFSLLWRWPFSNANNERFVAKGKETPAM